jgi:hypothetical protein
MARRIENQIERVFRKTFGARMGLRTLAMLGAQQMLAVGASPSAIRAALTSSVEKQLRVVGDDTGPLEEREAEARTLTALMAVWVAEVCGPARLAADSAPPEA